MAHLHSIVLLSALAALPPAAALTPIGAAQFGSEQHRQAMGRHIAAALARESVGAPAAVQRHGSPALAKAGEAEGSNCAQGKLLPEFYVLGAKNTATSSLWADLAWRGVLAAPGTVFGLKEWQFFQMSTVLPESSLQALWMNSLLGCPPGARRVMADFSVTNLFSVPLPSDFVWSQPLGYPIRDDLDCDRFDSARRIQKFHAEAGVPQPKFVIMLREPLARQQSEYYHTLPLRNCFGCMANSSFYDSFVTNVALLQMQPPQMSDWFWKSFYSRQIEDFLKYFDADHFYFAPDKEYFAIDPPAFSSSIISWLNLDATPWSQASQLNVHSARPPLEDELPLDAPARVAYEAIMAKENARLVHTLTQAHAKGAQLQGYAGAVGDEAAVWAWLQRGW